MIYSDLFDAPPPSLRNRVYARLRDVLADRDPVAMGIVRETKTNLPQGW